ncbi:uncharacterized protein LOC129406463 [Sorex araneus]|uniref:uncharacterized protein LOC129406463 n=1 Tax=Sorex araneus TaxID=42254 RepID=UPI00243351FD|nr:uncharacterized protein LOC129406463 [Sorex araneus]
MASWGRWRGGGEGGGVLRAESVREPRSQATPGETIAAGERGAAISRRPGALHGHRARPAPPGLRRSARAARREGGARLHPESGALHLAPAARLCAPLPARWRGLAPREPRRRDCRFPLRRVGRPN